MTDPKVTVVIPARNAEATLGATLAGLEAQEGAPSFELIVVDNASEDATAAIARESPLEPTVLRGDGSRAGSARNLGVEQARAPRIAFVDADCVPTPGWLAAGVEALGDADIVQGSVSPPPDVARGPYDRTLWVPALSPLFETANMFVSRQAFDRVGGFTDVVEADLEAPFGEDVWFGWRARRAGASVAFCERALAHHAVFERGPREFVAERARLAHFPELVRLVPELRRELLWRRAFLSQRTAAFDLGLAGAAVGIVAGSPLPLIALIPYAAASYRKARPWGRRAPEVALVGATADLRGALALAWGSLRHRRLVL